MESPQTQRFLEGFENPIDTRRELFSARSDIDENGELSPVFSQETLSTLPRDASGGSLGGIAAAEVNFDELLEGWGAEPVNSHESGLEPPPPPPPPSTASGGAARGKRPLFQFSSCQKKERAIQLETESRASVLRAHVANEHHVGDRWICGNTTCRRECGVAGFAAAVQCKDCKQTFCPDCDWNTHTHVHETATGFHRRRVLFVRPGSSETSSRALPPLQFVRVTGALPAPDPRAEAAILTSHLKSALKELQCVQGCLSNSDGSSSVGAAARAKVGDFIKFLESELKVSTDHEAAGLGSSGGGGVEAITGTAMGQPQHVEIIAWTDVLLADSVKHPVLMPMHGTCTECGCNKFRPDLSSPVSEIKLVTWAGVGTIHSCDWRCLACNDSIKNQHNGTAWLLAHGVMPSTARQATTVISTEMLDMLAALEAFHGSNNPASFALALEEYYKPHGDELGRPVEGYEIGKCPISKDVLGNCLHRWKALKMALRLSAKQDDSACTGCAKGVIVYSTDGNLKAQQIRGNNTNNDTSNLITSNLSLTKGLVDHFQDVFAKAKAARGSKKDLDGCADRKFKAKDPATEARGQKNRCIGVMQATCEHGTVGSMSAMHQHENTAAHALHHLRMIEKFGAVSISSIL